LILGTLIAVSGGSSDRAIGAILASCTGAALIAVGRADLDEATPSGGFLPLAFRGTLICMLVMAMADARRARNRTWARRPPATRSGQQECAPSMDEDPCANERGS
jgi:hypothetical protein